MKLCECGCGEPAVYAARHVAVTIRREIVPDDYVEIDCGYETLCWIWKGRRADHYANVRIRGTQTSVHRAMYLQEKGPIPEGAVVDHLCGEKRCIRPTHLDATSIGANVRRSVGFLPDAEALAEIVAKEIPARLLAEKHGVSARTIYAVRSRERSRHPEHPA